MGTREAREEEWREEVSSERELSLEYTSLAPSQLRERKVSQAQAAAGYLRVQLLGVPEL